MSHNLLGNRTVRTAWKKNHSRGAERLESDLDPYLVLGFAGPKRVALETIRLKRPLSYEGSGMAGIDMFSSRRRSVAIAFHLISHHIGTTVGQ